MKSNPIIFTKWNKGRLVIMGGSPGTAFTVNNAANAARRTGCGLVVACIQDKLLPTLDGKFKINTFGDYTTLDKDSELSHLLNKSDAFCFGIGIEEDSATIDSIVSFLLKNVNKPIILDADGVKVIINKKDELKDRKDKNIDTILTLNPQETEHVFGNYSPDCNKLALFARKYGVYIVLKGSIAKIFSPNGNVKFINTSDCPEMANAGCGDVLTGLIGGFIAQGISPLESILGAIEVRRAGAKKYLSITNDVVVQPEDIVDNIRYIIKDLHPKNKNYF
ncbi:MAG: NAD(P)H-hydrate dehydratase [Candidatus Gracilibacteria bacterium]|nr:NAD(P)H-hydrate dehydratase [Candidatus Gracilibacteria bacterium]